MSRSEITDEETGEKREESAHDWMEGTYDIRYTGGPGEALPGRGDPGGRRRPDDLGEHCIRERLKVTGARTVSLVPFNDNLGLDDYCEELCMATNWSN